MSIATAIRFTKARAAMDYTERANDPVRYAYRVLNFTPDPPVNGLKIWPHSDEDTGPRHAIDAICADPTVKKDHFTPQQRAGLPFL